MKEFIKSYWKLILFFTLIGAVGGFCSGLYLLESYPAQIQQQIREQGVSDLTLGLVSGAQSAVYGLVLGSLGIFFSKKIGLWKDEYTITKKPLLSAVAVSVFSGLMLILPDLLYFGRQVQAIMDSYASKPSIPYLLATVTYGAVIEEVMLRLFMMSLVAFILYKIFQRKAASPTLPVLIAANVISALLFAVGHLPATFLLIGDSPMIIFRCILLNGLLGLLFGRLYRKYGLRYAMIAHAGCHIVSKLIWIIFL